MEYDDKCKRTALHVAAFKSREGKMVALLLKHGTAAWSKCSLATAQTRLQCLPVPPQGVTGRSR